MDDKISRREFLNSINVKNMLVDWVNKSKSTEQEKKEASLLNYFKSPMHSYPLLQEMPWEMLLEEADKHNILTENRSKNDIARDLFILISEESET